MIRSYDIGIERPRGPQILFHRSARGKKIPSAPAETVRAVNPITKKVPPPPGTDDLYAILWFKKLIRAYPPSIADGTAIGYSTV
jgi:hypothetical protein